MKARCLFILFHFILGYFSFQCLAQQPVFDSYTVSQGLPNSSIRCMIQDSKGFMWIGTWEGLSKYDGYKFQNFTVNNGLPHNMINDLRETENGEIMVAMNNGVTSLVANDKVVHSPVFTGVTINSFFTDQKNNVFAATDANGVIAIQKNKLVKVSPRDSLTLYNIIQTRQGTYIATADKTPVIIFNKNFEIIYKAGFTYTVYHVVIEDYSGNILIGTLNGLRVLKPSLKNPGSFELVTPPPPFNHEILRSASVEAIFQDKDSCLWFGTDAGLLKVHPSSGLSQLFTEFDGLPSNRIQCIMRDREHNLWVGTSSGIAKMPLPSINVWKPPAIDGKEKIYGLHPVGIASFLLLTSNGIYSYHLQTKKFQLLQNSRTGGVPIGLRQSFPFRVIYENKMLEYNEDDGQFNFIKDITVPDGILSATSIDRNTFALGYFNGVLIYHNGKVTRSLDSLRIQSLFWDKNRDLWAGTWDDGLFRIKFDTLNNKVKEIENLTPIIGYRNIRSLLQDKKGNIWIGTRYNGVVVLSFQKGKWNIEPINYEQGLTSDFANVLAESPDGSIWAGSLSGIYKIIQDKSGYRVFNFSRIHKFFSQVFMMSWFPGNEVWGLSEKGVFQIHDRELEKTEAHTVFFTNVRLGKSDSNYAHSSIQHSLHLKYNNNFSRFEFTSPGYINESELLYSYRLAGSADTTWSVPSNVHSVQYASLQPGDYRFEVKMLGWNGQYGPVSQFPFTISPPFWKTGWFYLILLGIIVAVIIFIYQYRVKQLVKIQHVRNNIATDLHDDIGSTLTNISILSQLTRNNLHQPKQAGEFLSRISDEVENSSQALDDIIWSVNSRNDSLSETLARMRRFAGDLFDNSLTQCRLDIEDHAGDKKINMEQRRDLYLIYKESLANIHKHANAGHVCIRVSLSNNLLTLEIEDDGKGFKPDLDTHRNGIKNLKHRVEKWQGKFTLVSEENLGTRITMKMPVKDA